MRVEIDFSADHIRDNFDIFDFSLTQEEMERIAKLDDTKKYYEPDNETEEKYATMELARKNFRSLYTK